MKPPTDHVTDHVTEHDTQTNDVAIQTPLIEILRSVPKSCREMIQDGEHSHRNIPYGRLCHEAATELTEKTNEVARLRELLERVMQTGVAHYTSYCFERCICGAESVQEDIQEELARPDPAPEEPTIKESLTVEPEWRELSPDEVIQEGDECRFIGEPQYEPVMDSMIGGEPRRFRFYRFRTRRPLPKQEPLFPPIHPKQVLTPEERTEQLKHNSEVARLKEMVMDAARRGDEMAAHWQERAEKAEAIIQQLHHYAGIVEGFQTTTNK